MNEALIVAATAAYERLLLTLKAQQPLRLPVHRSPGGRAHQRWKAGRASGKRTS